MKESVPSMCTVTGRVLTGLRCACPGDGGPSQSLPLPSVEEAGLENFNLLASMVCYSPFISNTPFLCHPTKTAVFHSSGMLGTRGSLTRKCCVPVLEKTLAMSGKSLQISGGSGTMGVWVTHLSPGAELRLSMDTSSDTLDPRPQLPSHTHP